MPTYALTYPAAGIDVPLRDTSYFYNILSVTATDLLVIRLL